MQGLEPLELRALVPYSGEDDRLQAELAARITVAAGGDNARLISSLLRAGARLASDGFDADDYAAWLAVDGAEGLDGEEMIGVLAPDEVAKVAEFLSRARPEEWMRELEPDFADAEGVVFGTRELLELYGLAAAAGEAVIVMVFA